MNSASHAGQNAILLPAVVLAACAFAVAMRWIGLGVAPLIDDEYYLVRSVHNILATGLPEFETGGFYTRGLIQQYFSAALAPLNLDLELSMRLLPYICGMATIPAVLLLAQRAGGSVVMTVAVVLFCLSIWVSEFTRFARMYAPFLMVFMWFLVAWTNAIIDRSGKQLAAAFLLALISLGVYAGSAFLIALCFVPALLEKKRLSLKWIIAFLGIALLFVFSRLGVAVPVPLAPADLSITQSTAGFSAVVPKLAWLHTGYPGRLAFVVLLLSSGLIAFRAWRRANFSFYSAPLFLFAAFLLLAFHQFLLSSVCMALLLLLDVNKNRSARECVSEYGFTYFFAFLVCGIVITLSLYLDDAWYGKAVAISLQRYDQFAVQLGALLFNFPELIPRSIKPLLDATPKTAAFLYLGLAIAYVLSVALPRQSNPTIRLLIFAYVLGLLFVGVTGVVQTTTRYSYFLYALLIIIAAYGYDALLRLFIPAHATFTILRAGACIALALLLCEDFAIRHHLNMTKNEVMYRESMKRAEADHYLPRRDFESPSKYVNEHMGPGDIVISALTPAELYLDSGVDYMYIPHSTNRFWERNVTAQNLDVWTNAKMIYRPDMLEKLVADSEHRVWLLVFRLGWNNKTENLFRNLYEQHLVYESLDSKIDVFRIPSKSRN